MEMRKNVDTSDVLEYMDEQMGIPVDDLMYDLIDELMDESGDGSLDEHKESTELYLTEVPLNNDSMCFDQVKS